MPDITSKGEKRLIKWSEGIRNEWDKRYPGLRLIFEFGGAEKHIPGFVTIGWATKKFQFEMKYKKEMLMRTSILLDARKQLEGNFEERAISYFLRLR